MATSPSLPTTVERRPLLHRRYRPWLAALLSFIFPGLGQAYAGNPRMAAIFAFPVVLLITVPLVLSGLVGEPLRNSLLSRPFLVSVLAMNLVLFAWRAIAIAEAGIGGRPSVARGDRRAGIIAAGALVLLTGAMHGWVAVVVSRLDTTLAQVFEDGGQPGDVSDGADGEGGADPAATPAQPAYRWDGEGRINFLLLGTDAAPGRDEILTDVVLVLSLDPAERTAAMISVPRDTGHVPLPDTRIYADGLFPGKANELASAAAADPELWCPDMDGTPVECGIRTVREAIGLYVGLELPYYAIVDMAGFAELIDAMGGVELCLPGRLVDPLFGEQLRPGDPTDPLVLPAGCNHYGGLSALAFARSRQGWIEMPDGTRLAQTDFDRNERQQQVLIGVRNELAAADLFSELPDILRAVGRTVDSDFPRDQAGDLASLLPLITGPEIERIVLDYPRYVDAPSQPEVNYLLEPRRNAIREEMGRLFGRDDLRGWYLGTNALGPPAAELDGASNELPPNL